jgi:hypothetical protein
MRLHLRPCGARSRRGPSIPFLFIALAIVTASASEAGQPAPLPEQPLL